MTFPVRKLYALTVVGLALWSGGWAQHPIITDQDHLAKLFAPIVGDPYLFDGWVRGKVESRNPFFANDSLWFNYDLASGKLVATVDQIKAYLADGREFQSITFYLSNTTLTLEHVSAINDKDMFFDLVKSDHKYSLYKHVRDAIRGRRYAEWFTYYLLFPAPDGSIVKWNVLDKRLILRTFALSPDKKKVADYFSQRKDDTLNESFMRGLVEYLNE
jgi:hypothetical protein